MFTTASAQPPVVVIVARSMAAAQPLLAVAPARCVVAITPTRHSPGHPVEVLAARPDTPADAVGAALQVLERQLAARCYVSRGVRSPDGRVWSVQTALIAAAFEAVAPLAMLRGARKVEQTLLAAGFTATPFAAVDAVGLDAVMGYLESTGTAAPIAGAALDALRGVQALGDEGVTAPATGLLSEAACEVLRWAPTDADIIDAVLAALVRRGCELLDAGAVHSTLEVDAACIALGIPRALGGPMQSAADGGLDRFAERAQWLATRLGACVAPHARVLRAVRDRRLDLDP
jgi:3-hydroxyacyl-CoA dehydrogenase